MELTTTRGERMTTAPCSLCRNWFRVHDGRIRNHADMRGNHCWGSGLAPFVDQWSFERESA